MPDKRVQAAIENWAPRFTSQGVDYNDFIRCTSGLENWADWLDAWVANGDMHSDIAREAEAAGKSLTAGEAFVRAALSYHFAKFVWMVDMAKYRAAADKAVNALQNAHRNLDPTAARIETVFEGSLMVGNFRRPPESKHAPLVLLLPGLDSTKEEFFNWENVFLQRGMATLSMEGPGQGETGYATHIRPDYEQAVTRMLDAVSERGDFDRGRIGIVGVSMGGYYAPRAAAFEKRLKAVATIGGPYNFGTCWPRLPPITRETFVHHSGSANEEEARRFALQLDLEPVLPYLDQPLLVVFGKLDRLIPWEQAVRVSREASKGELVLYEDGNHVCNNMPYRYRPLVADWIRDRLSHVG